MGRQAAAPLGQHVQQGLPSSSGSCSSRSHVPRSTPEHGAAADTEGVPRVHPARGGHTPPSPTTHVSLLHLRTTGWIHDGSGALAVQ